MEDTLCNIFANAFEGLGKRKRDHTSDNLFDDDPIANMTLYQRFQYIKTQRNFNHSLGIQKHIHKKRRSNFS